MNFWRETVKFAKTIIVSGTTSFTVYYKFSVFKEPVWRFVRLQLENDISFCINDNIRSFSFYASVFMIVSIVQFCNSTIFIKRSNQSIFVWRNHNITLRVYCPKIPVICHENGKSISKDIIYAPNFLAFDWFKRESRSTVNMHVFYSVKFFRNNRYKSFRWKSDGFYIS